MTTKTLVRTLLTTAEIAERLGYTVQHTRLLIRQNKLPAQKVGRDWVLNPAAVESFIKAREKANAN